MPLGVNTKVFRGEACNLLSKDSTTIKTVITMLGGGLAERKREGEGEKGKCSKVLTVDGPTQRVYECLLYVSNFSVGLKFLKNGKEKRQILRSCGVEDYHLPYSPYYTSINMSTTVIAFGEQPHHTFTHVANLKL